MSDLFFTAMVLDAAKKVGMTAVMVSDRERALARIAEKPALVVIDLNCKSADPLGLVRAIKADPETRNIPTLAFVPHVQVDLRKEAEQAGCDTVVARSAFAQTLPEVLKKVAG